MKMFHIVALGLCFLTLVHGDVPMADYYYHQPNLSPAMWVFGTAGIFIYNADGSELKKHLPAEEICLPLVDADTNVTSHACAWRGVVSDGANNVWATNTNAGSFVEVFNVDKGMHVATLPTCGFPWNIDFNPLRNEVWVQCWSPKPEQGDDGQIDVFSTASVSLEMTQIALGGNVSTYSGHGTVVTDSSMPNTVYGNVLDAPLLFEIDANTKAVVQEYPIPDVSGVYRMEYSHVNRHLFLRGYVCCSCGFEESDLGLDCGRGEPSYVDVVTGPNQATNVTGKCGHSCEGTPADVLGVLEWDTQSKEIVGYHLNSLGYAADPYIDPSGKYLIMLANDGGREATIVKTGKNGEPSKQLAVVDTGFSEEDGEKGIWDVCFIEQNEYDIAIFVSTLANFVVLADMRPLASGGDITTEKVWLVDDREAEVTSDHGRGARRNCAWAFGSPYVWIDAGKTEEVHILELSNYNGKPFAKRIRNVAETPSRLLAWVSNKKDDELLAEATLLANSLAAAQEPGNPSSTTVASASTSSDEQDDYPSHVAIAGLVVGVLALVLNLYLLSQYQELKKQTTRQGNVDVDGMMAVSLESKNMEAS